MRRRIAAAGDWIARLSVVRRVRAYVDDQVLTFEAHRLIAKHGAIQSAIRRGRDIRVRAREREIRRHRRDLN